MIHSTAIIEKGATICPSACIGAYCFVDKDVVIENEVVLESHVSVQGKTYIGKKTYIHSFAVIGGLPQIRNVESASGVLEIGERNIIREHVTIHVSSSRSQKTYIGHNNYLMVGSHVGHDSYIGNQVTLTNGVLLAGHTYVDDRTFIGGNSAVHQWVRIGKGVMISGETGITRDIPPYALVMPAPIGSIDGINFVGLKRFGFSKEQIKCLKKVYDEIFFSNQQGITLQEKVQALQKEGPHLFFIQDLIDFMIGFSHRGFSLGKNHENKKYS